MSEIVDPPVTGDQRVDVALARVAILSSDDVSDHVETLREAHEAVQTLLREG